MGSELQSCELVALGSASTSAKIDRHGSCVGERVALHCSTVGNLSIASRVAVRSTTLRNDGRYISGVVVDSQSLGTTTHLSLIARASGCATSLPENPAVLDSKAAETDSEVLQGGERIVLGHTEVFAHVDCHGSRVGVCSSTDGSRGDCVVHAA